jgi:hypothetical protein
MGLRGFELKRLGGQPILGMARNGATARLRLQAGIAWDAGAILFNGQREAQVQSAPFFG